MRNRRANFSEKCKRRTLSNRTLDESLDNAAGLENTMKQTRLYSLFEKVDGKWIRQSGLALHKDIAVKVFQGALLNAFFAGRTVGLRVVKAEKLGAY